MQRLGGWHTRGLCVAECMMYGHARIGYSAVTLNGCAWILDLGGATHSCWSIAVEALLVGRLVARLRASYACPHTVA